SLQGRHAFAAALQASGFGHFGRESMAPGAGLCLLLGTPTDWHSCTGLPQPALLPEFAESDKSVPDASIAPRVRAAKTGTVRESERKRPLSFRPVHGDASGELVNRHPGKGVRGHADREHSPIAPDPVRLDLEWHAWD